MLVSTRHAPPVLYSHHERFDFTSGLPTSLLVLFLPAVGLLVLLLLARLVSPGMRAATPGAGRATSQLVPALLLVSLLTWSGASAAADRAWFPSGSPVSAPDGQTTTLAYCSPGGDPLAMDVSEPPAGAARPAPAVVYVHGGEGLVGDRVLTGLEGPYLTRLRVALVGQGFVVGSIDYRLA